MTTTLSELRDLVLQRCDMVNSNFVSEAELNAWINQAGDCLFDLIVSRYEDYYTTSFTFTIAGGQDGYTIPDAVYKLRGLDYQLGGDWVTLHTFTFEDRNRGNRQINRALLGLTNIKYRMVGNRIMIIPADQAPGTYQAWYIPDFQPLIADNQGLPIEHERWKEYIIADAAIKCLLKEESDPSGLMAEKAEMEKRILNMAQNRDAGSPERVQDVRNYIYDDPLVRF